MNEYLFQKIKKDFPDSEIIIAKDGKYLFKDCLFEGISLEMMPNNHTDFTVRFKKLKFFDLKLLQNYFSENGKGALKYKNTRFIITDFSIYVYINYKQNEYYGYEVFKYTEREINKIISEILNLLRN